jgi:hypothetical protein
MENSIVPPDKMEPILLKLFMFEAKFATLLHDKFRPQWFVDEQLGTCATFVFKFYTKYMKLPTMDTLNLVVQKTFETSEEIKEVSMKLKGVNGIDLEGYDRDHLEEEVITYLKNAGTWYTISSNIDDISESRSVLKIMDGLQFLTSMSFDVDLGMDFLEDIDEFCEELQKPDSRVSTGWDMMDKVMNGGMYRDGRCLVLFMGQTHIGKSLFLSNLAANMIKNNKFVVVISLEMSEIVYATRIGAHLTNANVNKLEHHTELLVDKVDQIKNNRDQAKLVIKEFPPDCISCANIKHFLDRIVAVHGRNPDCILIDYIQLMVPEANLDGNSYGKYRAVATEMRRLSYLFPAPIVSVSQVNRCLDVNSKVISSEGFKKIGDVKVGDKLLSWNDETVIVKKVWPRETKHCFKIKTKSGKEIICSENHQFPVFDSSGKYLGEKSIKENLSEKDILRSITDLVEHLDEIESIEPIGLVETVDITTDGDHLFYAQDILTHNSAFGSTDPGLDDTSDSMGIPFVADFVGGLYQNEGDRDACLIHMTTLKNRLGGQIGRVINFNIDYNSLKITDVQETSQIPEEVAMDVMSELEELE